MVDPENLRAMSVVSMVLTSLLGAGWLIAAWWSVEISTSRIRNPHLFEDVAPLFTIPLCLALWAGFLLSGTLWAMRQRAVAVVAAAGDHVRDPYRHAQVWFSSVVMWWEPLRNVLS